MKKATEISPQNISVCVFVDGKHYPTIATRENMEMFRGIVAQAMDACEIMYTKSHGFMEINK